MSEFGRLPLLLPLKTAFQRGICASCGQCLEKRGQKANFGAGKICLLLKMRASQKSIKWNRSITKNIINETIHMIIPATILAS